MFVDLRFESQILDRFVPAKLSVAFSYEGMPIELLVPFIFSSRMLSFDFVVYPLTSELTIFYIILILGLKEH